MQDAKWHSRVRETVLKLLSADGPMFFYQMHERVLNKNFPVDFKEAIDNLAKGGMIEFDKITDKYKLTEDAVSAVDSVASRDSNKGKKTEYLLTDKEPPAEKAEDKMTEETNENIEKINPMHSSAGLRSHLFQELERLRSGESNPTQAKAVAVVAEKIIKSVEVQMQYEQLVHQDKLPANGSLPEMPLGLTHKS
jgi:hypothetical protein